MDRLNKQLLLGTGSIMASKKSISGKYFPHFHEFYEIEYVIKGNGRFNVNGKDGTFTDGTLFFITPIDHHSVETDGAEIINIMFSEELVNFQSIAPFLRPDSEKFILTSEKSRPFFEIILNEIIENKDNVGFSTSLIECLLKKSAELLSEAGNGNKYSNCSKIHSYIINNYRSKITLSTAQATIGLTPTYISALFKKEMKVGFKEYLNSLRLEYAKKLLLYTEKTVRQIAEESGFDDLPNFIKRFKAYSGTTPTEFRKSKTRE